MVSQLADDGLPLSTIVMLSCSVGQQEVQSKTLQPETTYYACAVGVNSNATINGGGGAEDRHAAGLSD